jgi:phosphoheptose isomerase
MESKMLDLDQIEQKHAAVIQTPEWERLVSDVLNAKRVFAVGNGGLWAVASHGSDDVTRLTDKPFISFDSTCMLTSIANDYGYENAFGRWLHLQGFEGTDEPVVIIGLSCSGTSPNVVNALQRFADHDNVCCHLISGHPAALDGVNNIAVNTNYFHVCEILSLILFYELVVATGNSCPLISEEKARKGSK